MRIRRREIVKPNKQVENYETLYRKHKSVFFKSGLLSILFLLILAFSIDHAMTRWLTTGVFLQAQVMVVLGVAVIGLIGLIDQIPKMVKAHIASADQNIKNVLQNQKIISTYRKQLLSVSYDIISVERLVEDGIAPRQLEQIIRNILATARNAEPKRPQSPSPKPVAADRAPVPPFDPEPRKNKKDAILLSLREKEHEIRKRIKKGNLSEREGRVHIESARREAKRKLQALDDLDDNDFDL
ncbi:MAG: hypothetical protein ACE5G1_14630 [bacterium]